MKNNRKSKNKLYFTLKPQTFIEIIVQDIVRNYLQNVSLKSSNLNKLEDK